MLFLLIENICWLLVSFFCLQKIFGWLLVRCYCFVYFRFKICFIKKILSRLPHIQYYSLSLCVSLCLCLSLSLSLFLSVCLSVCLSLNLSVCLWLILILRPLLWIMQINGHKLNCDIIKDFTKIQRLFKVIYLETRDRAWSLEFDFLQNGRICSLKFKLLYFVTTKSSSILLDLIT